MMCLEAGKLRELVSLCKCCKKDVYCIDGFFNGVHTEEKEIYCFECYEKLMKENENPQS